MLSSLNFILQCLYKNILSIKPKNGFQLANFLLEALVPLFSNPNQMNSPQGNFKKNAASLTNISYEINWIQFNLKQNERSKHLPN